MSNKFRNLNVLTCSEISHHIFGKDIMPIVAMLQQRRIDANFVAARYQFMTKRVQYAKWLYRPHRVLELDHMVHHVI